MNLTEQLSDRSRTVTAKIFRLPPRFKKPNVGARGYNTWTERFLWLKGLTPLTREEL